MYFFLCKCTCERVSYQWCLIFYRVMFPTSKSSSCQPLETLTQSTLTPHTMAGEAARAAEPPPQQASWGVQETRDQPFPTWMPPLSVPWSLRRRRPVLEPASQSIFQGNMRSIFQASNIRGDKTNNSCIKVATTLYFKSLHLRDGRGLRESAWALCEKKADF